MTLEQKVGQIIMPEINSISPAQVKKFQLGTILNGGGGFPNQNKNSDIQDWKDLSESYYDASPEVSGIKIPILWGTDAVHGHNNVIGATIFPHNIGLGSTRNPNLIKRLEVLLQKKLRPLELYGLLLQQLLYLRMIHGVELTKDTLKTII